MRKPVTPGWPESGGFPAMPFPWLGTAGSPPPPLMQGFTGGIDLLKEFWSRLPGGAALPGFLVPTVDVEELDKRIGDLRAAERWVEVNLGMLRTTIQGLEVQRHTIAAIQSLTTPVEKAAPSTDLPPGWPAPPPAAEPGAAAQAAASLEAPVAAIAANEWLAYLQAQFAKVAQTAMTPAAAAPSTGSVAAARKKAAKAPVARAAKPSTAR